MTSSEDEINVYSPKKKSKRLQYFKTEWCEKYNWLYKNEENHMEARCRNCRISFSVAYSGLGAVS